MNLARVYKTRNIGSFNWRQYFAVNVTEVFLKSVIFLEKDIPKLDNPFRKIGLSFMNEENPLRKSERP